MVSQNSEFSLSSIWWLSVETDTTALSYWLNWRVLACAIWVLLGMALSALLIWRYEGHRKNQQSRNKNEGPGFVYKDEIWGTCSRWVHPIWLLGYRVVCFCVMLALVLADIIASGGWKFNFYTQWTFALVTIYFGLGSSLSIYGCLHYRLEVKLEKDQIHDSDADHDSYLPATPGQYAEIRSLTESLNHLDESNCRILASGWGYALQIVFQMCAGAVVLTDLVYWLIIYPFLTPRSKNVTICLPALLANQQQQESFFDDLEKFLIAQLAICFYGLVVTICSRLVCSHWVAAFSMFWDFFPRFPAKEPMFITVMFLLYKTSILHM
ncbi:uncharacterized protein LOC127241346 isoform X3 [Andrographis paniculata]|uniref:uncharacterized protein LOC127241346 isoform X3 n=1 Tax=Andrographis paniculata TaxID=175694 RepID=UPI0021E90FF6|nr:uncharacterized protein LOC127241346 isoform X3 [Andrographis paniculata]